MTRKKILLIFIVSFSFSQGDVQYIDGVAAIVEDHVVLKSDLIQMVNMAAIQNKIDPRTNPDAFIRLQNSVIQSMVDQKIMLEMAELDSIVVDEKEVNQALDQQIQMLVAQAGGESQAEDALGQPIKDFRREFWYDMKDRMISERYQQQLLSAVVVTRSEVKEFYKTYKDSLPVLPMMAKVRHLQIPIKPGAAAKEKTKSFLSDLKSQIVDGNSSFSDMAKAHSLDPSKNNGGELGWVKRGSLVKSFETTAFTIELGEVSDPVETEFGYHILETLEKQGDKIRVRHILMSPEITKDDNERAYNLAFAIRDSATTLDEFKKLVKKHSSDKTTTDIGGDLGWIDPTNYAVPEIGQAIKYIEMGSCSPPVNSSVGFHLLWVGGLKKGGRPNLQDHWAEVESMALNKKKMDWYQGWISNARKKFHIQITSS
jgi:peptidyl-prolyl cis-trans isomerase SurA